MKQRRDELLNRACNRQERVGLQAEVETLNRQIEVLERDGSLRR